MCMAKCGIFLLSPAPARMAFINIYVFLFVLCSFLFIRYLDDFELATSIILKSFYKNQSIENLGNYNKRILSGLQYT